MTGRGTFLKSTVKALARKASGRWIAGEPARRVVVLCYHSIHPTKSFASATPVVFSQHLDWLAERCDVVPLAQIVRGGATEARARPAVVITFDDGYLDNYEYAFPILASRGLPATFFVTVGLLEKDPAA